ncbi:MAG: N-acetylneuraminate synthase [Nitrospiraceae bacterium]|nr:MAG: N-acetylneuraminate synthase [Nitrospiraceae bacterium]
MKMEIRIGSRTLGQGHPAYVIAEAGSNHNHDFEMAKALIKAAAEAGADAVKFQAFRAEEHYSKHTPGFTYLKEQGHQESTYELIRFLEINRDWHAPLIEYAKSCAITFLSSPCDKEAVDQLGNLNMAAFKVASFDLPDIYLIRHMAKYGKPVILSTGMADYADIKAAIQACLHEGNENVILLQCTSLYPAPAYLSNLAAMETMRKAFDCPVGYSDHTTGDHISLAAVALGACMIEKHFTLDRKLSGPDHGFAIEPPELSEMIRKIREIESAIGDGIKNGPLKEEKEMFEKGRRSLHTKRAISAGESITRDDICIKRPGYGISPHSLESLIGMTVCRDIPEDHWITWEDIKSR